MTATPSDTRLFWGRMLSVVDAIDSPAASIDDVRAHLLAVDEGFSNAFDPADHYPEYVAVQLCRSLRRKLDGALPQNRRR